MLRLHEEGGDIACRLLGLSAHALNRTIDHVHAHRLTKRQHAMFALADMMSRVEVGIALARKADRLTRAGDAAARKLAAMSRIFAREVAQLVAKNALEVLLGAGVLDAEGLADFKEAISFDALVTCQQDNMADMDLVADILFARA
jgi:alkylation response protein AidB-like acyl-CoA dehydrogenase